MDVNNGINLDVYGNWIFNSGSFTYTPDDMVRFYGPGQKTITPGGQDFPRVAFSNSGAVWSLGGAMTADYLFWINAGTVNTTSNNYALQSNAEGFRIDGGTLVANGSMITVKDEWRRTSGAFVAGTSTVNFTSLTVSTITGSTTFYGMRSTVAGSTVAFTAGSTQYVTNMVEFRNVGLRSSGSSGTTWYFS